MSNYGRKKRVRRFYLNNLLLGNFKGAKMEVLQILNLAKKNNLTTKNKKKRVFNDYSKNCIETYDIHLCNRSFLKFQSRIFV